MPISKDFTSIFYQDWEINFLQCYPNGLIKYTELCNIFQLTAAKHAELGGISFSDMQEFHQAWVLSRMRIEINRLPKWKDCVTVKTWINSLENSRSIRCLELYIGDEKLVGCETYWAVLNTQSRKAEALAIKHDHFEKFPNDKANEKPLSKIESSFEKSVVFEKRIVLSDLDIVNHANSVKYIEWCLDTIDVKLIMKGLLKSFEVNYLKEVSLNDIVIIEKSNSNNPTVFTVNSNEKMCFALELDYNS